MRPTRQTSDNTRIDTVDALRGFAVAMMVAYHFCYDLGMFRLVGWTPADMVTRPGWIAWRTVIVSLFLALVGASLALRQVRGVGAGAFWKRWARIAAAAALVSAGSWTMFGPRFIYFGVLHFIAAALLIVRLTGRWGIGLNSVLGTAALALASLPGSAGMNAPPLNITGLYLDKPPTEDFVPLLPWLGVVWIGFALGMIWAGFGARTPRLLAVPVRTAGGRALAHVGRWSLTIYLVHQPLLIGALMLLRRLG
ncbi:DUF1624 domain-containing protein [Derxia gummosa]|uniref:DUF1624 domain-containing protein n=1 Tax=Derxia gummosa DSM 723 TaxID=1121388 RepID=A0A8B6X484_9BURK|nr:heparan-alpha-glucosaminide N-acetyltransferase [Derxia gummosa]